MSAHTRCNSSLCALKASDTCSQCDVALCMLHTWLVDTAYFCLSCAEAAQVATDQHVLEEVIG